MVDRFQQVPVVGMTGRYLIREAAPLRRAIEEFYRRSLLGVIKTSMLLAFTQNVMANEVIEQNPD